ncbi:hypothetical protein ACRB68_21310 [Actinomadura sp. RB68]|uniref:HTH tetR-type domain-containing protein n=1 Tax=Actinomadura macrotermitis TaxID=2585200 RepID=A0A7K0BT60_9ACTN|nr:hypothetical protein [Actinomadura macrotermitis]
MERLLETATRIFAELGYDATPTQLIADAAGTSTTGLLERFGSKSQLYREVMHRADQAEQQAIETAMASFTHDRQGILMLADAYLDFYVAHPLYLALWMHRWLGDAADVPNMEELYTQPLSAMVTDALTGLVPDDVDAPFLVWTGVWCVYGFLSGGLVHPGTRRPQRQNALGSADPEAVESFRAHLHTLLDRMLAPRGAPPAPPSA